MLSEFKPENDLEVFIAEAKRGAVPLDALLTRLTTSLLFVSSKTEVLQDGSGFEPLLLEQDGNPLVAVFSSLKRPQRHADKAGYVLQMDGRAFFLRLPPNYGVIVNPDYTAQLIIMPDVVSDLKTRLKMR